MKRIIKFALVMLLAVLSIDATFGQVKHVGVNLGSYHIAEPGRNNFNPGMYVRMHNGWGGGAFYNSFKRWAVHAEYNWDHYNPTLGHYTLQLGGAVGYEQTPVVLLLTFSKRFGGPSGHGARAFYVAPNVVHGAYEYEVQR